ncbi:MAG: hypothetical protein AB7I18_14375 [Candidatus Berkiella sp.]
MTSWKKLLANKQLIEKIELTHNEVKLSFFNPYNTQAHQSRIAESFIYLYSISRDFQAKFRRPQKKNWPTLILKNNHSYQTAAEVQSALSTFAATNKKINTQNDEQTSVKALAQFQEEAKAKSFKHKKKKKHQVAADAKAAESVAPLSAAQIRAAIIENTLFKNITIKNRDVRLTLASDFSDPIHFRAINQVLAQLQRTSLYLKNNFLQIKNVNRKPKFTLRANQAAIQKEALLNALMEAAPTPTKAVAEGIAPKTMDDPKQEVPKQEVPKQEVPKQEAPKQEAPKQEAPKQEAPKQETMTIPEPETTPQVAAVDSPVTEEKAVNGQSDQSSSTVTPSLFDDEEIWGEEYLDLDLAQVGGLSPSDELLRELENFWQHDQSLFAANHDVPLITEQEFSSLDPLSSPSKPPILHNFGDWNEETPDFEWDDNEWYREHNLDDFPKDYLVSPLRK